MSTAAKLKKRAIELEQKKQLDKALALYIQFLQESDGSLDDADIPLYNRVGDLMLRTGNTSDALNHYERAVDLYAERGFLNNAIALCNKVLRQAPGRASIYYKLGRISANKGFKSDAKKNFLEYADRMQKAGQINEAFRALKEFADLCPDQDDIRLMLAEQLSKENRQDEALEQLQKLHDKLDSEGRMAEARATADRMKSIDPEAVPRTSGSYQPQKSNDLIFLDISFEEASRSRQKGPPPGRQVSDPDLVVLTMGDQPAAPLSPVHNAALGDAFALDVVTPSDGTAAEHGDENAAGGPNDLPLLDVSAALPTPPSNGTTDDLLLDDTELMPVSFAAAADAGADAADAADGAYDLPSDAHGGTFDLAHTDAASLDVGAQADPPSVDLTQQSSYVSGPPLGIDYAADLASSSVIEGDATGNDLFDFRAPPRSDDFAIASEPPVGLDPDVAFPSLDLDDISLPSADDVTSGGGLAAALAGHSSLGTDDVLGDDSTAGLLDVGGVDLPAVDEFSFQPDPGAMIEEALRTAGAEVASDSLDGMGDWPESSDSAAASATPLDVDETSVEAVLGETAALDGTETAGILPTVADTAGEHMVEALDRAELELTPAIESAASHVAATPSGEVGTVESARESAEHPAITPSGGTRHVAPVDEWRAWRERAERLLESGDRGGGIRELEQMAADLERRGDLESASTIVDELIRLSPDSIRNHQKRVELAFRAGDRRKLIEAYIELGDALFRSGEERKAIAVYQRVLELAPDDARVRAALDSVRSASPPAGSDTITPAHSRPAAPSHTVAPIGEPAPRPASVPSHAQSHSGNGVAKQPPARKPSPLDRSAATADFVDLGDWLRESEVPKSTRMVTEEKPPSGDEQADFQEMLKRFKQGVADNVDEEDYESHYDLGVAYKEMGLMDEAVAEFQKALRGATHRVRAYEALGQCFVEKEQYQVASSVLSRAIALGEGDDHHLVGVLYLLGRATEALDRPADALDYYQRVFAVDIEFRDVAERISEIARKAT